MRFGFTAICGLIALAPLMPARADPVTTCAMPEPSPVSLSACTALIDRNDGEPGSLAWALNNRGLAHAAGGAYLAALSDFSRAIQIAPDFAPAHSNRGNAHAALGDMQAALADHETAIRLAPDYVSAHHNRAVDLEEMGRYREALDAYRKVIALDPSHPGSHVGLATASCKLGRVKASAEARLAAVNKGHLDPTEMQQLLQSAGFYKGPIDGLFGKRSRAALWAWTRLGCLARA